MKKIVLSTLLIASISTSNEIDNLRTQLNEMNSKITTLENKQKTKNITIIKENSPTFLLGKETHINMKIKAQDNPEMWLKAGVRIQGTSERRTIQDTGTNNSNTVYDAYLRRVRFEVAAGFSKYSSFVMDVRNDKANFQNKGEQAFNVGDAYLKIKKPFDTSLFNVKLYRAKIDISRTETVKSARVLHYDRPSIADEAAQFITHNRRGTNAQIYGDYKKKVHYQLAMGDGVYTGKLKDAQGGNFKGDNFVQKSFFYGGKLVLSPFDGWEEKVRTETYFGEGKHFEVGISYWKSANITYNDSKDFGQNLNHKLLNAEISAHYKGLFIQAEYFKFDGVVQDFSIQNITGKSSGWYATGEYVMKDFYYLAPFFRVEAWDKFEDKEGYDFESVLVGLNWYLRGNSTKMGLTYQKDTYDKNIGNKTDERIKLTTQWFF